MSAEDFEAWSTGQTLDYYFPDGRLWGSERHLPGRRTLDADADPNATTTCREGHWFPEDGAICFVYDGYDGTHCWRFWRDGDGVTALSTTGAPDDAPYEVVISASPLSCLGPEVGA